MTVSHQHVHTTCEKDLYYQYFHPCQVNKAKFSPEVLEDGAVKRPCLIYPKITHFKMQVLNTYGDK